MVAIGDSVTAGTACSCDPFPALYAPLLSRQTAASVTVENDGVNSLDTTGLLQLLNDPKVAGALRLADVVLVTIGANDFVDHHEQVVQETCTAGGSTTCIGSELARMRVQLAAALARIRSLRNGQPTAVLVTGYWNVFEDGHVARQAAGEAGLQSSIELTRAVNAAISAVASSAGARYVDLYGVFQNHGTDIDALLAPDGDHPNALGHRLIAMSLVQAGLPGLR